MKLLNFFSNILLLTIAILFSCNPVLALPSPDAELKKHDEATTATIFDKRYMTDVNCLS
ncbi:hypothetical protein IFR04_002913 [Cadophora malorum]|uniref:Uncharacterized protein n=1 Tax=Cadophora malorum TaxID=108018 RepID=A0A8H7WFS8_9HELO|nr:hypothetical protein IFR04_002913 [Cadophora malorum]